LNPEPTPHKQRSSGPKTTGHVSRVCAINVQ
jgi:hypothetical protein